MVRHRVLTFLGVALAVLVGVGFGLSRTVGSVPDAPVTTCEDPLDWRRAGEVVGARAAVAGEVVAGTHASEVAGSPTFLNLGSPHPDPDRFDIVIYPDVRERFDTPPEDAFTGRRVCVQGEVRDREGVPQIILDNRAMLQEHGPP
jgi:hypothetical protein